MTTVIDDASRRIMSVLLTMERPNTETLLVTVANGVRIRSDNGIQVGGVPIELHSDNGGEFKSAGYRQALAALGVQRTTTYPYMKHLNGKVERVQRTIQEQFVAGLIGYAHAGKTLSRKDLFGIDGPILTEESFTELLYGWIDEYNNDRVHTSIRSTPNAKWASYAGPLRAPDEEALRMVMLAADRPRKVQQRGVFFNNSYYTSAPLAQWIGRDVQVRYFPDEVRLVEVFDLKGNWITSAYNQATLTDAQAEQIRQEARAALTDVRQLQRRAAERRRAEALADPTLAAGIAVDHARPTINTVLGGIDEYLDYGGEDDEGERHQDDDHDHGHHDDDDHGVDETEWVDVKEEAEEVLDKVEAEEVVDEAEDDGGAG
jgi:putative transposase